jgi:hypothetical protein
LLKRGVDPNAKNKAGDSALSWALRRGDTRIVATLKSYGASNPGATQAAIEKSLALLQKTGVEFVKVSGCTSCHHQSLPQMAYGLARERGITVDAETSQKQVKSTIAMFKPHREAMLEGKENFPDPSISVSYSLIGLAAEGYAPDATTEAMAHLVSTQQSSDGSFRILGARPPMESSPISGTALSIRALQLYGQQPELQISRAAAWLRTVTPKTTEERAMQLLGLAWAKARPEEMREAAKALLALQKSDGGWAQLPALETDAYATGQALMALQASGFLDVASPIYIRSAEYLLRTQRPDGSWFVRSRSVPFQPYRESGFPYGKDQWISASGTGWATMALTLTLPRTSTQMSQAF